MHHVLYSKAKLRFGRQQPRGAISARAGNSKKRQHTRTLKHIQEGATNVRLTACRLETLERARVRERNIDHALGHVRHGAPRYAAPDVGGDSCASFLRR